MRFIQYLILFFACCFAHVVEITSSEEIVKAPYTLLYFYAPDCKFCNAFDPDFVYLEQLYKHNKNLQFAKINGRQQKHLVDSFGVNSFPSIKLYDTSLKRVAHFRERRNLENLEDFIADYTPAYPSEKNIQSNIQILYSLHDLDRFTEEHSEVVIAFVSRLSAEWSKHYYPHHFYQKVALDKKGIAFAIVFADEAGMDIMARYHISNFPSLLWLSPGFIKTLKTFSTNTMVNNDLGESEVNQFFSSPTSLKEYHEFNNLRELTAHAEAQEYEGHKQVKAGMNIGNKFTVESKAIEEEYEDLLRYMEL